MVIWVDHLTHKTSESGKKCAMKESPCADALKAEFYLFLDDTYTATQQI